MERTAVLIVAFQLVALALADVPWMHEAGIIPDIISKPCPSTVSVSYGNKSMSDGNVLKPEDVKNKPNAVRWGAEANSYYTIVMLDPDVDAEAKPSFLHYLFGDIPAVRITKGKELAAYMGISPPEGTGMHRYIWLVYKQQGNNQFSSYKKITRDSPPKERAKFMVSDFATKYKLGDPIACNMFRSQNAVDAAKSASPRITGLPPAMMLIAGLVAFLFLQRN
ncbi:PREDICTED: protein D1-like [Priapulus caudatus]|uniref:Protein D1-like n=1 Tax=Priapulus caudatus TaxID=37621 RepID=A0ABM1DZ26_PRICU|nr:PREDICTED: protein D1-like [Priapulus caudatus]